jgi:uncharacterized membrane protein YphA (DoxX/SURF4 family)
MADPAQDTVSIFDPDQRVAGRARDFASRNVFGGAMGPIDVRHDVITGPRRPLSRRIFVLPRVYAGVVFATAGLGQLRASAVWTDPGQSWPAALHEQLAQWAPHTATWYSAILTQWWMPHADGLAPVVAWLHLVIGVALVLGVATRLAAAVAIVMLLNYAAAAGHTLYGAWDTAAYTALALTVWLARAGREWGVDAVLARRWPSAGIW